MPPGGRVITTSDYSPTPVISRFLTRLPPGGATGKLISSWRLPIIRNQRSRGRWDFTEHAPPAPANRKPFTSLGMSIQQFQWNSTSNIHDSSLFALCSFYKIQNATKDAAVNVMMNFSEKPNFLFVDISFAKNRHGVQAKEQLWPCPREPNTIGGLTTGQRSEGDRRPIRLTLMSGDQKSGATLPDLSHKHPSSAWQTADRRFYSEIMIISRDCGGRGIFLRNRFWRPDVLRAAASNKTLK